MDYVMKITANIDTEAKKNTARDSQIATLTSAVSGGTIESWTMDIQGYVVEEEDHETYSG